MGLDLAAVAQKWKIWGTAVPSPVFSWSRSNQQGWCHSCAILSLPLRCKPDGDGCPRKSPSSGSRRQVYKAAMFSLQASLRERCWTAAANTRGAPTCYPLPPSTHLSSAERPSQPQSQTIIPVAFLVLGTLCFTPLWTHRQPQSRKVKHFVNIFSLSRRPLLSQGVPVGSSCARVLARALRWLVVALGNTCHQRQTDDAVELNRALPCPLLCLAPPPAVLPGTEPKSLNCCPGLLEFPSQPSRLVLELVGAIRGLRPSTSAACSLRVMTDDINHQGHPVSFAPSTFTAFTLFPLSSPCLTPGPSWSPIRALIITWQQPTIYQCGYRTSLKLEGGAEGIPPPTASHSLPHWPFSAFVSLCLSALISRY